MQELGGLSVGLTFSQKLDLKEDTTNLSEK
jgi:hypothetical protein